MAVSRTRTVKNKHASNKSGISGSKGTRKPPADGVVKLRKPRPGAGGGSAAAATQIKGRARVADLLKKRRKKTYSEAELGIPKLNAITPLGVQKPKGKKKGKVFVDDRESMNTILAMVQAEKEGQIESKMIKARQMEEIREARRIEAEKKEEERQSRIDDTKEALRKKRKRQRPSGADAEDDNVKDLVLTGTKAAKPRTKKKVAFA